MHAYLHTYIHTYTCTHTPPLQHRRHYISLMMSGLTALLVTCTSKMHNHNIPASDVHGFIYKSPCTTFFFFFFSCFSGLYFWPALILAGISNQKQDRIGKYSVRQSASPSFSSGFCVCGLVFFCLFYLKKKKSQF